MPISDIHRRKRAKNYFSLAVILLFIAGLVYLTMLKMGGQ
jgi:hypothetical protein